MIFKKIFIYLTISFFSLTANSTEFITNKYEVELSEYCKRVGKVANNSMLLRQSGMPLDELLKLANGNKLIHRIVLSTFEYPIEKEKEKQIETAIIFSNSWHLSCFKYRGISGFKKDISL